MAKDKLNIQLIIEGCRRGNRNSQRILFEYFFGYAMNICLRFSRNQQEAEEVLNTGFLKVFRAIDRYDPEYPFRTWLRRILVNAAVDHHRAYQQKIQFLELKVAEDLADEDLRFPVLLPDEDILPVLQKLSPMYRMVFNLAVMEGYKHDEIAELLNISASASRSNLTRAKQKLRALLSKNEGQPSRQADEHG
ncbi:MAG: sigma-70 family RNA polymerase sigma factor [Phaeodactylibacter sp.]|nr:sigma-70 family RNA polymerase sigma factor [Phaeodactylibacter sp.]